MHFSFTYVFLHKINIKPTLVLAAMLMLAIVNQAVAQSLPVPDHIVILIEENQANSIVIGDSAYAPYINQIANDSNATVFTQMYALTHPSQPNYLDLFAGSDQGVTDDNLPTTYPFTTANLARELLDKGLTFTTYSQDLPSVGFDGVNSNTGSYVRKHNPVTNWVGTSTNQVPNTTNQPFTAFPSDFSQLPTVSYVVPDEDSDMHNGLPNVAVPAGDFWFKEWMKPFIDWVSDPHNNTLFIYTFDEDDGIANNNIPTVFYGPMVQTSSNHTSYTLYSILRTIEDMYGLGYAGAATTTVPITDCWQANPVAGINTVSANLIKCYPNPASSILRFQGDALNNTGTEIDITDITGRRIESIQSNGSTKLLVNTVAYESGMYFYNMLSAGHTLQSGKFIVTHQ